MMENWMSKVPYVFITPSVIKVQVSLFLDVGGVGVDILLICKIITQDLESKETLKLLRGLAS